MNHNGRLVHLVLLPIVLMALVACERDEATEPSADDGSPTTAQLDVPAEVLAGIGAPVVPANNPLTAEGIA